MFFRPGVRVAVTLADGSALQGVTGWSWLVLRLRDASQVGGDAAGARFLIPMRSVLAVQIL